MTYGIDSPVDESRNALEVRLVVLSDGAHYVPADELDDAALELLVSETMEDWPNREFAHQNLRAAKYDRMPECGLTISHEGRLLAEPGCCATLSGVIAMRDLMLQPRPGTYRLFTGHDVTHFVELRIDQSSTSIEILTTGSNGENESFSLTAEQAEAMASKLSSEIETLIGRVTRALPADIADNDRTSVAQYLVETEGEKYW